MHLEVKVALNFIVSYLYNKLPRRRADLFGEELERILVARFEGHWYPEAPLRGSAFRCLHLGAPRDPVVELAAKRSGLDTEEVRANVPAELSVWIDPYEVSYQIGEKGTVKVLYLEDPPGLLGDGERPEGVMREGDADTELEEAKSLGFNPDAQVFVPIGSQLSPSLMAPLCASPTPPSAPTGPALFNYPTSTSPANPAAHSSNTSTPSPPTNGMPYLAAQQPAAAAAAAASSLPATRPQPITFTTAAFAATKFGSTKMKKCSAAGSAGASGGGGGIAVAVGVPPVQRLLSHSPTAMLAPEMLPHKSLSLSMHSLVGPAPSQLSPNAKEFVYPGSLSPLYFDADPQPMPAAHASRFKPLHRAGTFDPFSSPPPSQSVGVMGANGEISYVEKPQFAEGLGSYNLQYPSQSFQPVVLAN